MRESQQTKMTAVSYSDQGITNSAGVGFTYSLDTSAERRTSSVRDFKIRHAKTLLLLEQMSGEAFGSDALGDLVLDFIHELSVQLNILLSLREHLGFPGREIAWDVLKCWVALDSEFAGDTTKVKKKEEETPLVKIPSARTPPSTD